MLQIEALIGQGGHGAVHRARELSTGRPVALKVPEQSQCVTSTPSSESLHR